MTALTTDDSGELHLRLSRVQKRNLSAVLYDANRAWANKPLTTIKDVDYKDSRYVFKIPDEFVDGREYLLDVYNGDAFIKGYQVQTQDNTPDPVGALEELEQEFTLSETQELANELVTSLDELIAQGYYYHDSITIPSHILVDMHELTAKLKSLHEHMEGDVAQDAFLLRSELASLKSTIDRDNSTIRKYSFRTKKLPLSPVQMDVIATSVSEMIADALNNSME